MEFFNTIVPIAERPLWMAPLLQVESDDLAFGRVQSSVRPVDAVGMDCPDGSANKVRSALQAVTPMTFAGLSLFPVRPVCSITSLCSHNLVKLISSAKLLVSHAASIGAWPRSKTPPRVMIAQAIRAIRWRWQPRQPGRAFWRAARQSADLPSRACSWQIGSMKLHR